MRPNEQLQFSRMLSDAMSLWKQDLSEFALSVWWQACEKYELQQVSRALSAHAMDPDAGRFAPKPADIVRQLEGTRTDQAAMAWAKVYEAAKSIGAYTDVIFDDAAIHAAIQDMGGWPAVCRTETRDLSYAQHRFSESYRAYVAKGQFDYPKRLPGDRSPDDEYARIGLQPPKPAVIGDVEKARAVFSGGGAARLIQFVEVAAMAAVNVEQRRLAA